METALKTSGKMLLVSALLSPALIAFACEWKTFRSEKTHFTVRYPDAWYCFDDDPQKLFLGNFPPSKRLKGVVKPRGGATILVQCEPADVSTISEWLATLPEPLSKQEVSEVSRARSACNQLVQVEWEGEEGPNTYSHETSFFCTTGSRIFEIGLSNWRGDPKQKQLQQIALKMALNLRVLVKQ